MTKAVGTHRLGGSFILVCNGLAARHFAKGRLSQCKRRPFALQFMAFYVAVSRLFMLLHPPFVVFSLDFHFCFTYFSYFCRQINTYAMTFMKTPINRLLLCAVLALACVEAALGSTFRRLYGSDMLSSKLVTSICQDSRGYLWIATEYGLNRFDGVYFTQYYADTGEGLAKNDVQNVMPCGDGVLLDMYNRVQLYTPKDNRFHDIEMKDAPQVSIKGMVKTPGGDVWLVNSGQGIWQVDFVKMEARPVAKVNKVVYV